MNTDDYPDDFTNIDRLILDSPIDDNEIIDAISHLKKGKAAGPDEIVIEMFCSRNTTIFVKML